jgi:DNA invertase Pin-like site-specific DNA recombinase
MARVLRAIRVSVYRELDPTTSPERQRAAIDHDIEVDGDTFIGEAQDLDESAYKVSPFARKELGDWLQYRKNEFDKISWSMPDRAIRRMADMSALAQWAKENKKILHFCGGPAGKMDLDFRNDDPMTSLMLQIIAFAAEMETWNITQRALGSRAYLRVVKRYAGGWTPFGYQPVARTEGKGFELEPDPEYAPVLIQMTYKLLGGHGLTAIADWLNATGIPTSKDIVRIRNGKKKSAGLQWKYPAVIAVLRSRAMCGITEMYPDWRDGTHPGEAEIVYGDDGMPLRFGVAIINDETWRKVQERLDEISRPGSRQRGDSPWLTGVSICKICGDPLWAKRQTNRGKQYLYMRCDNPECEHRQLRYESLEEAIEQYVAQHWAHIPYYRVDTTQGDNHESEIKTVKESIRKLAGDADVKEAMGESADDERQKLAILKTRLGALIRMPASEDRVTYTQTGETLAQHWASLDGAGKHAFLISYSARVRASYGKPLPDVDIMPGTLITGEMWKPDVPVKLSDLTMYRN